MEYKKVSIIVPIYNSAPYLKECIQSVIKQTYMDFELLLIADGSTDGSEEICRKFARQDRRIRFLSQEHKGVSAARNMGMDNAEGEYLFFLDSDDAIHPYLLEKLLRLAEKTKAMIVAESLCSVPTKCFERKVTRMMNCDESFLGEKYKYLNSQEALYSLLSFGSQGQLYAIGGKMIREKAICAVRFDETLSYGEDTKFMYQLLAGGADAAVFCGEGYYYREHRGSLSSVRTIEVYENLYVCSKYIWFQEKGKGRKVYAQKCAEAFLGTIAAGHVNAHIKGDRMLMQYTLRMAEKGKRYLIAEQTSWKIMLECWLAFRCWPVYPCCYMIYDFWRRIEKKYLKKSERETVL